MSGSGLHIDSSTTVVVLRYTRSTRTLKLRIKQDGRRSDCSTTSKHFMIPYSTTFSGSSTRFSISPHSPTCFTVTLTQKCGLEHYLRFLLCLWTLQSSILFLYIISSLFHYPLRTEWLTLHKAPSHIQTLRQSQSHFAGCLAPPRLQRRGILPP